MGTYFHGNSEIQGGGDGLQTLILMNPGYVGFSDTQSTGTNNFAFLNSIASGNAISISHAPPHSQSQQFVGIPLATAGSLPQTSSQEAHASGVHSQHDITALHGLIRSQYSMYAPSVDIAAAREVPRAQGLSLSLSSQHGNFRHEGGEAAAASQQMVTAAISPSSADDPVRLSGGSSSSASGISNGGSRILSSKYLKAAQELLDEVVNVGKGIKTGANSQAKSIPAGESSGVEAAGDGQTGVESSSGNRTTDLTTAERQEIQMKKAKLVNMLDEVEQRYRQYHNQMHLVISWFEQAAGNGSAKTYTAVALQTISKQFRCLKDAILGQVRAASKSLGEECVGMKMESSSRLKFVDNHLRQQRALQQLGMIQHNAWRPQRGLPEPSVSVLRAWLFEHFLHPYPKDSDKIMLAKQTGLTRSQVSNWFINARVRLWKPMVEEMYLEEIKEQEKSGGGEDKTNKDEGSASVQDKSPASENLVGSSEIDSITQGSPKKARGLSNVAPSITMDSTKPMKFDNDRQNREEFSLEGSTNFMAAFGSYPMEQMGRFSTEDFPSPYSTKAVSLTLGLQHSENLSAMSATHHNFLPNQEMQMGRNDFVGGMNTPTSSHPTNVFENFNIQNRKRFPAQLLPDFVT